MGFFTRTKTISGQGWTFDKNSGRLTINGDMGDAFDFFDSIDKSRAKVRSIVALKGARVRNGLRLFSDMKNLISADLTELDVSECNIMYEMFAGCESLTTLDLSTWDVSNVEIMAWMFRLCSSLEELDLTSMDVSNVKNLSFMFECCRKLRTLNLGGWDTHNAVNMNNIFAGCESLERLDISGWQAGEDTDIEDMFLAVPNTIHVIGNGSTDHRLLPEGIVLDRTEAWQAKEVARAIDIAEGRIYVSNYFDAGTYFMKAAKLGMFDEAGRWNLADRLKFVGEKLLEDEKAEYNKEYYTKAKECFEWATHYGGSETAFEIGKIYNRERNKVPNHETEAVKWYKTAADLGSVKGLHKLACMYYDGTGVPRDQGKAGRMFEILADKNVPEAQYLLGTMYYYGRSWCEKDLKKAKELVKKVADQGYDLAKEMLRDAF